MIGLAPRYFSFVMEIFNSCDVIKVTLRLRITLSNDLAPQTYLNILCPGSSVTSLGDFFALWATF